MWEFKNNLGSEGEGEGEDEREKFIWKTYSSIVEAETGRLLSLRPVWATVWVSKENEKTKTQTT